MEIELFLPMFWEWLAFALRWFHIICAIAWIGSSFYFIALDLGLRPNPNAPKGVHGEEWQVHGGGFYHIQKYLVAPEALPEHLTWFKWESYMTWLSGLALMVVVYYLGADLYLIDQNKIAFTPAEAIGVSLASLIVLWLGYHALCRSRLGDNNILLMILLYGLLVALAWGYTQLFSGRAAFLHLGVVTATIMSANVFLVIIPNQKIVVADLKAGRTPDPHYGKIAKQRSTHNNYLTLPVLFLMLANHYPLAFATEYSWIIAALVFLIGVSVRHYFNRHHARAGNPLWTWGVSVALFVAMMILSILPLWTRVNLPEEQEMAWEALETPAPLLSSAAQQRLHDPRFEAVYEIVESRCTMCHAREPFWDGITVPPKGVVLETAEDVAVRAQQIFWHASASNAMPPANITAMETPERALIAAWFLKQKNR